MTKNERCANWFIVIAVSVHPKHFVFSQSSGLLLSSQADIEEKKIAAFIVSRWLTFSTDALNWEDLLPEGRKWNSFSANWNF